MARIYEHSGVEDARYHDTWKLLRAYRDTVWSLEVSVARLRNEFQIEYGTSIDEFLDSVYMAGADLGGTDIEQYARSIERSNKMLKLLGNAVEIMRKRQKNGEEYYWVLYYTYLSPQEYRNIEEIIDMLRPHIQYISYRTYYRKRREAVEVLSSILWGFSSKENRDTLDCFFPDDMN